MAKKIVAFVIWVIVSVLFVLSCRDIARSVGYTTSKNIETNVRMGLMSAATADELSDASDIYSNNMENGYNASVYNIVDKYKSNATVIAVTIVVYVLVSILCYHFGWVNRKDNG